MSNLIRQQTFKRLSTVGTTHIWQLKAALDASAFFYESALSVDADGAPKAYGPRGLPGTLDNLGNAGHPGNWWGIVTDKQGNPIQQNGIPPQQPYRDYYISPTSLINLGYVETDVRRYADATVIPYLALPPAYFRVTGLKIGDLALVINGINGRYTFTIFADSKNKPTLGEVSICSAVALGAPADPRHGGLNKGIITLVFPGSGIGQGCIPDAQAINVAGRGHLKHFSNFRDKENKLLTAFPEYPLFAKALTDAGYIRRE
ncbi:hypothetical protein [Runella salmonicolor]|uniref:Chitosanase of glycosyl hydrolase group 75 n=1 Tax=Runella salmonicolor TaxID=2950278 RepID=A0ABT1FX59_9BACT|nr:hypothetical protein [Runella salmonicolor]MCP1386361.1 hypothetical protein [Runella salmonicolor]